MNLFLLPFLIAAPLLPVQETATQKPLVVATKAAEPFAEHTEDGHWTGLSIELWEHIAKELELEFEYKELELSALLAEVEAGTADIAVAALTMTAEREEHLDFSNTILSSGLGIAVESSDGNLLTGILSRVFSTGFLKAVGALAAILLLFGFLVWLFERAGNPEEFGGRGLRGLGEGFWWSAVTMTTVGYGDRSPRTVGGRLVALVWMFASIILISSFTASIATSLTLGQMSSRIRGPEDLPGKRVGCVQDATGQAWLNVRRISHQAFPAVLDAIEALEAGNLDAVVHDMPILRYHVSAAETDDMTVLPRPLDRQDYAFAFPNGSALRESVNRKLLAVLDSPKWDELVFQFLGER